MSKHGTGMEIKKMPTSIYLIGCSHLVGMKSPEYTVSISVSLKMPKCSLVANSIAEFMAFKHRGNSSF